MAFGINYNMIVMDNNNSDGITPADFFKDEPCIGFIVVVEYGINNTIESVVYHPVKRIDYESEENAWYVMVEGQNQPFFYSAGVDDAFITLGGGA